MKNGINLDQENKVQFLELLKTFAPDLYMIEIALEETGVNPQIIPQVIKVIGNLTYGQGYGHIKIYMQARVITQIKGEDSTEVNLPASNIIDTTNKSQYT